MYVEHRMCHNHGLHLAASDVLYKEVVEDNKEERDLTAMQVT